MKYKRYEKYKDSGEEWIGEVPEHWKLIRINRKANVKSSKRVYEEDYLEVGIPFYRSKEIVQLSKGLETTSEIFISKELHKKLKSKYSAPKKDDLLITSIGTIGKTWISDGREFYYKDGNITQIDANKNINTKFIQYCFKSKLLEEQYNILSDGSTLMALTIEKIKQLMIMLPTQKEQIQITRFLDKKTQEIDSIINDKQKLISLLKEQRQSIINQSVIKGLNPDVKMKDSGIEWIGKVPEHWEVKRLKNVSNVQISNIDKKSVEGQKQVLLCNYVDVYYNHSITNEIKFMKATATKEQIKKFSLKRGDVLITKDSETPNDIAVSTFVKEELDGVVCGYHLAHIRPNEGIDGNYLYYSFKTDGLRDQYWANATGVTRFGLSKDTIKNAVFLIPPIEEQIQIAEFLNIKNCEINKLIKEINNMIAKLKEYRQSLIFEAVTGKIDVRDYKEA